MSVQEHDRRPVASVADPHVHVTKVDLVEHEAVEKRHSVRLPDWRPLRNRGMPSRVPSLELGIEHEPVFSGAAFGQMVSARRRKEDVMSGLSSRDENQKST
jgi:hypothetical protein